jgi:hypothetical protein
MLMATPWKRLTDGQYHLQGRESYGTGIILFLSFEMVFLYPGNLSHFGISGFGGWWTRVIGCLGS